MRKVLFSGIICSIVLMACGCGQKAKTYDIKNEDLDSKIQISLPTTKENLHFEYVGSKLDSGKIEDDGSITFYSEKEMEKQVKELGRENTLDIVEENGLKINYSAHPADDLSALPEEYDEYVYTISSDEGDGVSTVHILMNEEAFKNRLQHIQDEDVPEGMDIYSDGMNIQGFSEYGNIEMKWIPEAKKGYMIKIYSPDYDFADISCSIDLKKEIETDEEYYEAKKSEEEMTQYIADYTEESAKIEKIVHQDNIAGWSLPMYDDEGYIVGGISLYDKNGNVINIADDTEHKWCYDEKGWVVRADSVNVPYTLSEIGNPMGNYHTRYGDLVPIH